MARKNVVENNEKTPIYFKYAISILTIMGLLTTGFTTGINWLDSRFVNENAFKEHVTANKTTEQKVAELIQLLEEDRERDKREILKAIKEAKAFPLIIRRDTLLSRGEEHLTESQKAELKVLEAKLKELNMLE